MVDLRAEPLSFLEVDPFKRPAPLAAVAQAPVVVAVGVVGTEADGFGEVGDGAVVIRLFEVGESTTKKTTVPRRVVVNAGVEPRDCQIEVVFFQRLPSLLETGRRFLAGAS